MAKGICSSCGAVILLLLMMATFSTTLANYVENSEFLRQQREKQVQREMGKFGSLEARNAAHRTAKLAAIALQEINDPEKLQGYIHLDDESRRMEELQRQQYVRRQRQQIHQEAQPQQQPPAQQQAIQQTVQVPSIPAVVPHQHQSTSVVAQQQVHATPSHPNNQIVQSAAVAGHMISPEHTVRTLVEPQAVIVEAETSTQRNTEGKAAADIVVPPEPTTKSTELKPADHIMEAIDIARRKSEGEAPPEYGSGFQQQVQTKDSLNIWSQQQNRAQNPPRRAIQQDMAQSMLESAARRIEEPVTISQSVAPTSSPSSTPTSSPSLSTSPTIQPTTSISPTISPTTLQPSKAPTFPPTMTPTISSNPTKGCSNVYGNKNPAVGPWPECMGWYGEDCKSYIECLIPDDANVVVAWPGGGVPEYRDERVRVYTTLEGDIVVKVPERG